MYPVLKHNVSVPVCWAISVISGHTLDGNGIISEHFFFFLNEFASFFFLILFIYLFIIFGCVGSSPLCEGFLQLRRVGATLHRGARVSHCRGLSRCGAQAPDAQAQQLWLTGPVAPWHVGSSQTRARTRVPCIGRQILNHCATREAPQSTFIVVSINGSSKVSPVL